MVLTSVQPQELPWLTASSRKTSHSARRTAPNRSGLAAGALARLLGAHHDEQQADRGHRGRDPEHRVMGVGVVGDDTGDEHAQRTTHTHGGADDTDRGGDLLAREGVPDDADAQRDHRRRRALQGAPGDHHGKRVGKSADDRADD